MNLGRNPVSDNAARQAVHVQLSVNNHSNRSHDKREQAHIARNNTAMYKFLSLSA
jgi:hypothetical protein